MQFDSWTSYFVSLSVCLKAHILKKLLRFYDLIFATLLNYVFALVIIQLGLLVFPNMQLYYLQTVINLSFLMFYIYPFFTTSITLLNSHGIVFTSVLFLILGRKGHMFPYKVFANFWVIMCVHVYAHTHTLVILKKCTSGMRAFPPPPSLIKIVPGLPWWSSG